MEICPRINRGECPMRDLILIMRLFLGIFYPKALDSLERPR